LLLVAAWSDASRVSATADAAAQASLDPRFWRDLYPRIRVVRRLLAEQNTTLVPASVALARHWRNSRRVGDLPPQIGLKVSVDPGEATLILGFCENHRRLMWRRIVTLSALRLESFRQQKGGFPKNWKHSVPGGAELQLVLETEPFIRLTDRLDQIQGTVPPWLTPPTLPLPRTGPSLDYDCPLFGSPPMPEVSSH
jgi:hypothetical protein